MRCYVLLQANIQANIESEQITKYEPEQEPEYKPYQEPEQEPKYKPEYKPDQVANCFSNDSVSSEHTGVLFACQRTLCKRVSSRYAARKCVVSAT